MLWLVSCQDTSASGNYVYHMAVGVTHHMLLTKLSFVSGDAFC
jgi:hypothetical protein